MRSGERLKSVTNEVTVQEREGSWLVVRPPTWAGLLDGIDEVHGDTLCIPVHRLYNHLVHPQFARGAPSFAEEVTELLGAYFALCDEDGLTVDPREAVLLALGGGVLVEIG